MFVIAGVFSDSMDFIDIISYFILQTQCVFKGQFGWTPAVLYWHLRYGYNSYKYRVFKLISLTYVSYIPWHLIWQQFHLSNWYNQPASLHDSFPPQTFRRRTLRILFSQFYCCHNEPPFGHKNILINLIINK